MTSCLLFECESCASFHSQKKQTLLSSPALSSDNKSLFQRTRPPSAIAAAARAPRSAAHARPRARRPARRPAQRAPPAPRHAAHAPAAPCLPLCHAQTPAAPRSPDLASLPASFVHPPACLSFVFSTDFMFSLSRPHRTASALPPRCVRAVVRHTQALSSPHPQSPSCPA